jgi:putative membrane-bound dehydrogenase-like protein
MLRRIAIIVCWIVLTTNVSGQDQLRRNSGQPYLPPEETAATFRLPGGFEVKLVAAEPDVINPIAMCFDERGRLWVVESFEYPKGAAPGTKPRDRIKIFEDTDNNGRADKITIFADGLNLATGIAVGYGGVFVGAAPDLLFLRDTDGDDRADTREVLLTGFGREDTHELLNTFTWGPDGWLYGCHGVFTHSKVRRPDSSASDSEPPVQMNAAVWRYHPRTHKFDIFAEGTSNPWGIDFDNRGNMFLTCCVIPHMFHMIPGGRYIRQAGQNRNPYDFGQLPEISDHLHHEESGWAHAGCVVLDSDMWPAELRGSVIFGSIHGNSIKRDVLRPNGSTFTASHAPDFLQSADKNFRPVNQLIGPDGAIYIIDWCDQWPCHQTPPDLWDKERGRVFKIQRTNKQDAAPTDLGKLSDDRLVDELASSNPYVYRTALRLLAERQSKAVAPRLRQMIYHGESPAALRGLWALNAVASVDRQLATELVTHPNESIRIWAIRLAPEAITGDLADRLLQENSTAAVRLQMAASSQQMQPEAARQVLSRLAMHGQDADDRSIPLMIWFALEPLVERERDWMLEWLKDVTRGDRLISRELVPRVMRRLVATRRADHLQVCIEFASTVADSHVRRSAIEGVVAGLAGRRLQPPSGWPATRAKLMRNADPELVRNVRRLGAHFRDSAAIRDEEATAVDGSRPEAERVEAVRSIAVAQLPESLEVLQRLLAANEPEALRGEALRSLGGYDSPRIPRLVIDQWQQLNDRLRTEAQTLLTARIDWASALLDAIAERQLEPTAISASGAQRIAALKEPNLTLKLEKTWGSIRQQTPAEIDGLIARMRIVVERGQANAEAGKQVFEQKCAVCHKFNGRGADVGPDITGSDRSIEYLLINILDPTRVVGQPYYTHVVATKGGRVVSGKLVSDTPAAVTLQGENNKIDVIARDEIEDYTVKHVSVMPEGLPKDMTEEQFRDLIRFLQRKQ